MKRKTKTVVRHNFVKELNLFNFITFVIPSFISVAAKNMP